MNRFLDLIEKRLEDLFEGSVDRIFNRSTFSNLLQRISSLVLDNLTTNPTGEKITPDLITVMVSKEKFEEWEENQALLTQIADALNTSAHEMGFTFNAHPQIVPMISDELKGENITLHASFSSKPEPLSETSIFSTIPIDSEINHIPKNAFIIVNGATTHILDKNLINIGRRSTSDVVVEDPQVSRDHLQLRASNGRYLVFDLDSTGGTFLNGAPCRFAILSSGDIIRIGSTFLIYSQDMTELLPLTTKFEIE